MVKTKCTRKILGEKENLRRHSCYSKKILAYSYIKNIKWIKARQYWISTQISLYFNVVYWVNETLLPDMPTTLHIQGLEAGELSRLSHCISLLGKNWKWHQIWHFHACFCLQLFFFLPIFRSTGLLGRRLLSTLQKDSHPINRTLGV